MSHKSILQVSSLFVSLSVIGLSGVSFAKEMTGTEPQPTPATALMIAYDSMASGKSADSGLSHLRTAGCDIWRRGKIDAIRGSIDLGSIDTVALLQCSASILSIEANRKTVLESFTANGSGFVIEGNFNVRESVLASGTEAKDRGYVIKISYLNNRTHDRESEEDAIDRMALTKPTGWQREARIYTTLASGISTPDAVGVLYFPTPSARDEFRMINPDVMRAIGAFNQKHLAERAYLYMSPN